MFINEHFVKRSCKKNLYFGVFFEALCHIMYITYRWRFSHNTKKLPAQDIAQLFLFLIFILFLHSFVYAFVCVKLNLVFLDCLKYVIEGCFFTDCLKHDVLVRCTCVQKVHMYEICTPHINVCMDYVLFYTLK